MFVDDYLSKVSWEEEIVVELLIILFRLLSIVFVWIAEQANDKNFSFLLIVRVVIVSIGCQ